MPALEAHPQSSSDATAAALTSMSDIALVRRVRAGDGACFAVLMRRYNQRLFRTARSIVRDDDEAEDVIQQAYVNAYLHLDQFAERAQFSTWLTRIAIHEAWSRVRRQGRLRQLDLADDEGRRMTHFTSPAQDPEARAYRRELAALMEHAIAALPEMFRTVLMLRDVEGLSTQETAECLGLNEITVKTRLHRARGRLRRTLTATVGASAASAFQFDGARCDRVVAAVMHRLDALRAAHHQEDRPS